MIEATPALEDLATFTVSAYVEFAPDSEVTVMRTELSPVTSVSAPEITNVDLLSAGTTSKVTAVVPYGN